jgi:predicted HAD superfamily phosphohydrolase YqeG
MGMFTILIEPIAVTETSTSFHLLRQVEFTLARALGVSLGVG